MKEIDNKFLLAADNFLRKMHSRQHGFTYSACGPFKKTKRTQKFKEAEHSQHIYQNKLDQACFQHDMAYGDFEDLTKE